LQFSEPAPQTFLLHDSMGGVKTSVFSTVVGNVVHWQTVGLSPLPAKWCKEHMWSPIHVMLRYVSSLEFIGVEAFLRIDFSFHT
jgi:hypothetical protein